MSSRRLLVRSHQKTKFEGLSQVPRNVGVDWQELLARKFLSETNSCYHQTDKLKTGTKTLAWAYCLLTDESITAAIGKEDVGEEHEESVTPSLFGICLCSELTYPIFLEFTFYHYLNA